MNAGRGPHSLLSLAVDLFIVWAAFSCLSCQPFADSNAPNPRLLTWPDTLVPENLQTQSHSSAERFNRSLMLHVLS